MSPAMPAFSSSRRSMRSMKAFSWSAATDSVLKAASSMRKAPYVWCWRQCYGYLVEAVLMPRLRFLKIGELGWGGLALVAVLPFLVGHAVDVGPALILGKRDAPLVGGLFQPVRQAIPAEPRQIHKIDVLN